MELEGKAWKDSKLWLVEIPILDIMTQGKSKKGALHMFEDNMIGITVKDTKILLALSLISKERKAEKHQSSLDSNHRSIL